MSEVDELLELFTDVDELEFADVDELEFADVDEDEFADVDGELEEFADVDELESELDGELELLELEELEELLELELCELELSKSLPSWRQRARVEVWSQQTNW